MTIRFAASTGANSSRMSARARRRIRELPANDNAVSWATDALLHAALRHFAEHGLSATRRARKQAEAAFFAGDRQGYQWWLEVCRALDRRMASELDMRDARVPAVRTEGESPKRAETPTCKA